MIVNPLKQGKDARRVFSFNKIFGTDVTQRKSFLIFLNFRFQTRNLFSFSFLFIFQNTSMKIHNHWSDLFLMVTMFVFLHMARLALGRHIPWYVIITIP